MEKQSGVSMTIQNDSYTIQELIQRQKQGFIDNIFREGQYSEDATHEDIDLSKVPLMDLVERQELSDFHKQKAEEMRENAILEASQQLKQQKGDITPPPQQEDNTRAETAT